MLFSVVICTYNRSDLLGMMLQTIQEQTLARDIFEVIVVDNRSTDDTKHITERFFDMGNVRYVYEEKVGLSHARNRGMTEAQGEYVVYSDDDCKVPPHWLENAYDIVQEHAPDFFGGPFFPFYLDDQKPDWYLDMYGSYSLGEADLWLTTDEHHLAGGNMFIKRSLLIQCGGFDPSFGMTGKHIGYAEEAILQLYIRKTYPETRFFYSHRLWVHHLVRPEKMHIRWAWRANIVLGRAVYRMNQAKNPTPPTSAIRFWWGQVRDLGNLVVKGLWDGLWNRRKRDRGRYPTWRNYFYDYMTFHYIYPLGQWLEKTKTRGKPMNIIPDWWHQHDK